MGRLANRIDTFTFFEQLKMRNICVLFILKGLFLLVLGENQATESIFPSNTNLPIKIGESEKTLTSECCDGITGIDIHLSGDPAGYQFGLIGHYNLQDDLVNGKRYWVKDNYAYGIWYTNINTNAWIVGSIGNLGSSTGGLGSACTEACGYCCEEWQYSNTIGTWTISDEIQLVVDEICSEL